MAQPTASVGPTGGVKRPIPRLRIMMIPKCTGSMPNWVTIGRKIGVQISSIGARSMKVPSTSSSTLIRSSRVYLSSATARKNCAAFAGTCISAIR